MLKPYHLMLGVITLILVLMYAGPIFKFVVTMLIVIMVLSVLAVVGLFWYAVWKIYNWWKPPK